MMNHDIYVLLIIFIVHKGLASALENNCPEYGAVRLNSTVLNVGQVNFCDGSQWGTICNDGWDHLDAAVVCRELGYTADGAESKYYNSDVNENLIVIENVNCYSDEMRLRDCPYSNYTISHSYQSGGIAGVGCKIIKNINFATVNNSVLVTWEYTTSHQLSLFYVRCNGRRHYDIILVSNGTSRVIIGDLLPNTSYDCCVSAKYVQRTTEIRCASIRSEDLLSPGTTTISDTNMMVTMIAIGAVLGCIIVILLVLLALCGGALFHLLRSRTSSDSEVPKRSATEMTVGRNVSYLGTTPSTTSGAQATDTVAGHTPGAQATEYSRIGPSYETIANSNHSSMQQPVLSGGNGVSDNLSERYEFSESHLATGQGGGGGGVGQREAAPVEYEVPLQSGEHTEYSHLQH